ncbi:SpoIIE family protein phosphatase [Streptomyces sp. RS10V-4]|uniref:SpoIIE family protein phosphatase n=1 Tax=Streptomyces rhizoryzae TaxID=2932493 RepID=UPI0020053824|nr:SpoIIE family protein phosphatase [Streptomyces rhizoryzae]MCK7622810.1 SpoIIE family protein phosphatase [Streptomyces rhizoryzae]
MGTSSPAEAASRRLPPAPESVVLARRFVRAALAGSPPDTVRTAELLAGELVTNAVLHARTEIEVRAWAADGRVDVRVTDRRPERGLVPHERHPYAATGRGLMLVEELAPSHGVHVGTDHKTVWFDLWAEPPAPPTSVWEAVVPAGPTMTVTLIDLPYAVYWGAQQQWEGLLREVHLATAAGAFPGIRPDDLAAAQDVSNVISACMTAAVEQETPDSVTFSLLVAFPADAAPAVATLAKVLDTAEAAAQQESLLALPSLPQLRAFRHWLLDQITGQLAGADPTAWTLVPGAAGITSAELAPWDAGDVEASTAPTVAIDDGNRIIALNDQVAELLGWSADELVGQDLDVLIPEHLRERHTAAYTSLMLTGQPRILGRPVPVPALHRDGRLIPIRLTVQTQQAVDGRTVFVAHLTPRTVAPLAPRAPDDAGAAEVRSRQHPVHAPAATRTTKKEPEQGEGEAKRDQEGEAGTGGAAWQRLSLLAATGSALTSSLDPIERLRRVCRVLAQRLADWCAVDLLDEAQQGHVERVCVVHRDPRALEPGVALGPLPPVSDSAPGSSLERALRGAGPLLLPGISGNGGRGGSVDTRQQDLFAQLGASSAVIAPLRARREVLGALTMVRVRDDHPFTEEDILLVAELVRSIGLAVDNARLHRHVQHTAERLQRSLLPPLPHLDHLALAARYAPSSTTAQIGGDWYDAFVLPGGDTALVIGDVAGHDLRAAVAMSSLRNMLRGLAVDRRRPPGDVLRRLDVASQTLYPHATATCILAMVEGGATGPWTLHHSSAGHLPPLLTTRDGETRYLDEGPGLLIGMDPDLPRPTARDPLPPHSTLLLYTDGLIERPGESLDDAMTRLRRHTAAVARAPLDSFCDELVFKLGSDSTDDIAVLAVRPTPPPD